MTSRYRVNDIKTMLMKTSQHLQNCRLSILAIDRPTLVLRTPGGPTKHSIGPQSVFLICQMSTGGQGLSQYSELYQDSMTEHGVAPVKLSAERLGNGSTNTGLADTRRTNKAQYRTSECLLDLPNCQVLNDSLLQLVQTIVVYFKVLPVVTQHKI